MARNLGEIALYYVRARAQSSAKVDAELLRCDWRVIAKGEIMSRKRNRVVEQFEAQDDQGRHATLVITATEADVTDDQSTGPEWLEVQRSVSDINGTPFNALRDGSFQDVISGRIYTRL